MNFADVGFEDLKVQCIIGDLPVEREKEQTLFFTVSWFWDLEKVAVSDSLDDVIDYTAVAKLCRQIAVKGQYRLIETLAEILATQIIETFGMKTVSLTIRKPAALAQSFGSVIRLKKEAKQH